MKRMVLTFAVVAFTASLSAQRLNADEFFNRYSDSEGYTTVVINGSLLGFLGHCDTDESGNPLSKITSIRLVVRDKDEFPGTVSFLPDIRNIIRKGSYDELMSVRNSDTDLRFMVKTDREIVKEILLVVDGEDEAVVQIKGNLTRDEASRLFESDGKGLEILEGLEISRD